VCEGQLFEVDIAEWLDDTSQAHEEVEMAVRPLPCIHSHERFKLDPDMRYRA
jgi:hypothetical protein